METFPVRKRIRLDFSAYRRGHVFFITMRTHRGHPWFLLHPSLADFGVNLLHQLWTDRGAKLYTWCVMPDHIHLLLQDEQIVDFVRLFKGRMTPRASALEKSRRLWQRSFYDHALRGEESLAQVASYVWENPVRTALVENPLNYPWSGSGVWPNWREFYGRG